MTKQSEPEQWAIKQHLEKNPLCGWLCKHINLPNLGEEQEEITDDTQPE